MSNIDSSLERGPLALTLFCHQQWLHSCFGYEAIGFQGCHELGKSKGMGEKQLKTPQSLLYLLKSICFFLE